MGRINRYSWESYSNNYTYPYNSQTIFFRAKLRIEFDKNQPNIFAPAHNDTKYLKVRVYNYGKSTAHKCNAKVKVIPDKFHHFMDFPSQDIPHKLVWGSEPDLSDLEDFVDIQKDSWDIQHIVFANSSFYSKQVDAPTRYASFSQKGRLKKNELRIEDSFTNGDFDIEISIFSDETNTKRRFKLHIDTNYINLGMKMLPLSKKDNIKYQLSRIF